MAYRAGVDSGEHVGTGERFGQYYFGHGFFRYGTLNGGGSDRDSGFHGWLG